MITAATIALLAGADQGSTQSFWAACILALLTSGGFWAMVQFFASRKSDARQRETEDLKKRTDELKQSVRDLRRSSFLLIDAIEGMMVKLKPDDDGKTWSARLVGSEVEDLRREIRTARSYLYEGT